MTPRATVSAFLDGRITDAEFDHRAHLYLAAWCVLEHGPARALEVMRELLQAFLAKIGVRPTKDQGYHETITRFWVERVTAFIQAGRRGQDLDVIGVALAEAFGDKRSVLRWYSKDRISSWAARTGWLPPDLDPEAAAVRAG